MEAQVEYHSGGELVEIRAPRMTVVLTKSEWIKGIRRGKAMLRSRRARDRDEARIAKAVDATMGFPRLG